MKSEKWRAPFDRAGMWVVGRFPGILNGRQGRRIKEKLRYLETTKQKILPEEYYGKKFSNLFLWLFFGGISVLCLFVAVPGGVEWMEKAVLARPGYGRGTLETELTAGLENGERLEVPLSIGERQYSSEEIQKIFEEEVEKLGTAILGENSTLEEVRKDLELPATLHDGMIQVEWYLTPSEYMDDTGRFYSEIPEEGVAVVLRAVLNYHGEEMGYEFPAMFYPPILSPMDELRTELARLVEEEEKKDPQGEEIQLPQRAGEETIRWGREKIPLAGGGLLILFLGLWYLYGKDDRNVEKEAKRKRRQMVMDYPSILYKMSMLLGAGMTIRGAFSKIALHYKDQGTKEVRYAYEEMLNALYDMEKGVGEAAAYEKFGQNCQDLRYLKFGSLLSQNLKKGSTGLENLLWQEAEAGMEERKNLARKLGEEAGIRLLMPMMLMLILVMAILMIPAMLSF